MEFLTSIIALAIVVLLAISLIPTVIDYVYAHSHARWTKPVIPLIDVPNDGSIEYTVSPYCVSVKVTLNDPEDENSCMVRSRTFFYATPTKLANNIKKDVTDFITEVGDLYNVN